MARKVLVRDRKTALVLGIGLYLVGTLFLWDAYEHRGTASPFALRFLPGA